MATTENIPDRLWVAIHETKAFIHVQGRGSFKISTSLKQFGTAAIEAHCTRFILDMADCVGMDSTFMGVLAGLAFSLRKACNGDVVMVNLSPRTNGLLCMLGLDLIIKLHMVGAAPEDLKRDVAISSQMAALEFGDTSQRTTAETMLAAHETLVELAPENLPKFKDVLMFLRKDLAKMDDPTRRPQEP